MQWWHYLVLFVPILLNFYAIWHVRMHYFSTEQEKSYWFLLAVFVPIIGGLIYILFGRKKALKAPLQESENVCTHAK